MDEQLLSVNIESGERKLEDRLLERHPQLRVLKTRPEVEDFQIKQEEEGGDMEVLVNSKDGYKIRYVIRHPKASDPEHIRHRANKIPLLIVEACEVINPDSEKGIDIVAEKFTPKGALWVLRPNLATAETPEELREENYSLDNDSEATYIRNIFHQQSSVAMPMFDAEGRIVELTFEAPLAVGLIDLATVCHEFGHLNDSKVNEREVATKEGFADNFKLKLLWEIHERLEMTNFLSKHIRKVHKFTNATYFFKHIGTQQAGENELVFSRMRMKSDSTPFIDVETVKRWKEKVDQFTNQATNQA